MYTLYHPPITLTIGNRCCVPWSVECSMYPFLFPYHELDVMPRERVYLTCLSDMHSVTREENRTGRWIDALGAKQSKFY
jgi:hypothetical protein